MSAFDMIAKFRSCIWTRAGWFRECFSWKINFRSFEFNEIAPWLFLGILARHVLKIWSWNSVLGNYQVVLRNQNKYEMNQRFFAMSPVIYYSFILWVGVRWFYFTCQNLFKNKAILGDSFCSRLICTKNHIIWEIFYYRGGYRYSKIIVMNTKF